MSIQAYLLIIFMAAVVLEGIRYLWSNITDYVKKKEERRRDDRLNQMLVRRAMENPDVGGEGDATPISAGCCLEKR